MIIYLNVWYTTRSIFLLNCKNVSLETDVGLKYGFLNVGLRLAEAPKLHILEHMINEITIFCLCIEF